jgi:23S rRNA pseudouridine1911/1915/1917 synthase
VVSVRTFVLGAEHVGQRIDVALTALLSPCTRAAVQRAIEEGGVLVDGRTCRPKDKVRPGMVAQVSRLSEPLTTVAPDASVRFEVLYEDEALLVVNKPAGLVVHPARGHATGTLVAGLLARPGFESAPADPQDPVGQLRPGIVHRLDKETSGVLVVAKQAQAREHIKAQLARHSIERVYDALTVGVPEPGTIDTLHGRHPRSRLKFSSEVSEGRRAVTVVSVAERYGGQAAAWVRCTLHTGRTHQIRVHLSERAGAPILADALYGRRTLPPALEPAAQAIGRHALHARVLGFIHPLSQAVLRFEAPLPPDFAQAQSALRSLGVSAIKAPH